MDFLYEKHNPWWNKPRAIQKDVVLKEYRRQKFKHHHWLLNRLPSAPGVVVVRGPRRIGKTTLLKLLIKKLFEKSVDPKHIFYYPCNRIKDYNQLYDLILGYLGRISGHSYLLLDEITFVSEWQRTIKDLWDSGDLHKSTVFLTGSNALDLKFSSERLPGRRGRLEVKDVNYWPLTFTEFALMAPQNKNKKALLQDYLICGGFPQSINEYYSKGFISNSLYEEYLDWIEGDMHKAGKSEKLMYAVLTQFFKHLTSTTSWYIIAKNADIGSHSTVSDYVDILEKLFVSFSLHYFSIDEQKVYLSKNKKLYFTDPIIMHAVKAKIDGFVDRFFAYSQETADNPEWAPKLAEQVAGYHLYTTHEQIYYGNYRGKEVDFVTKDKGKFFYYEVKHRQNISVRSLNKWWKKKNKLTVINPYLDLQKDNLQLAKLPNWLLNL